MKTKLFTVLLLLTAAISSGNAAMSGLTVTNIASGIETDPSLTLEDWMVNSYYWEDYSHTGMGQAREEGLALESWMTSVQDWEMALLAVPAEETLTGPAFWLNNLIFMTMRDMEYTQADDDSAVLEPWMTSITEWETAAYTLLDQEKPLALESWMSNPLLWTGRELPVAVDADNTLTLESWMVDEACWVVK